MNIKAGHFGQKIAMACDKAATAVHAIKKIRLLIVESHFLLRL